MCHLANYFHFIYDCYKTAHALYIVLYFILNLIEHSEVKLRLFLKNLLRGGKIEKIASEMKIPFSKGIFRILT